MKMKKLTALLLSAIMAISSVSVTAVAEGSQVETGGQNEAISQGSTWQDVDLTPTGGVIQPQSIEVSEDDVPEDVKEYTIADYAVCVAEDGIALFTADGSTERYDSDYGLQHLGEIADEDKAQALYSLFDVVAEDFEASGKNMVPANDANLAYVGSVNYNQFGLTKNQALAIYNTWQHDHPKYFWLWGGAYTSKTEIYAMVDSQYFSAEARREGDELIAEKMKEFKDVADRYNTAYDKAMIVHDIMTSENIYDYDSTVSPASTRTAHNVLGSLDDDLDGVCESFAKAYSMAMNYIGVECIYAVNYDHAWNYVKMDDGNYYGVDVTWDVNWNNTAYYNKFYEWFGKGSNEFTDDNQHIPYDTTGTGFEFLYSIPDMPASDYKTPETSTIKYEGFTYSKVGHSLILTDATSATGAVAIPDRIDNDYVRVISSGAFANSKITSIYIPESVAKIDESKYYYNGAFYNCTELTNVTLPSTLRYLGSFAFFNCNNIDYLYIPYKTSSNFGITEDKDGNKVYRLVIGDYAVGYKSDFTTNSTIVRGKHNSHAEKFAAKNGLTFWADKDYISDCDIKVYATSLSYAKYEIKPYVTVREDGKYLVQDVDYTLEYKNNVNEGTASITIKGIDPYAGEVTKNFEITACEHFSEYLSAYRLPTCIYDGVNVYTCPTCGNQRQEIVPAKGHSWGEWATMQAATRTTHGRLRRACQTCGIYDYGVIHHYSLGKCTVADCGVYENGVGDIIGTTVSLSDAISINFYADLSSDANADDVVMEFTVGDETITANQSGKNDNGLYRFECPLNSKQMDATVTAKLVYGDKSSNSFDYSVLRYVDSINKAANDENAYNHKEAKAAQSLVNATYLYGITAKSYFDNNGVTISADDLNKINAVDLNDLKDQQMFSKTDDIEGISLYGRSLVLESKTILRVYFNLVSGSDISNYTFTYNNQALTPTLKNGRYYVDINDIAPHQLGDEVKLTVSKGTETMTVTDSPLTYVYAARNRNSDLVTLLKAFVLYNKEAKAYTSAS